jgi:hypothetical protein
MLTPSLTLPAMPTARAPSPQHTQTPPQITEIAQGPQPTRRAVDEYRDTIAVTGRENGQAARFVLQTVGTDPSLAMDAPVTPQDRPFVDAKTATDSTAPPLAPREVIPRDPAPEPRITLTL